MFAKFDHWVKIIKCTQGIIFQTEKDVFLCLVICYSHSSIYLFILFGKEDKCITWYMCRTQRTRCERWWDSVMLGYTSLRTSVRISRVHIIMNVIHYSICNCDGKMREFHEAHVSLSLANNKESLSNTGLWDFIPKTVSWPPHVCLLYTVAHNHLNMHIHAQILFYHHSERIT